MLIGQAWLTERNMAVAAAVVIALPLTWLAWRWFARRRARRRLLSAVTGCGFESLQDVLVPDGGGGHFHADFLVLTTRGVLVVDLREVTGNVFGGDQMTAWTVMNGPERYTFQNPQGALYDRVAAVKTIVGEIPVEGRVVFNRSARFPKGLPRWTVPIDSLPSEFPAGDAAVVEAARQRYASGWQSLASSVERSPLANPHLA